MRTPAQEAPAIEDTPLDKMLALLRSPDRARERLPELEQRWRESPSFLAGAELLAACESNTGPEGPPDPCRDAVPGSTG